MNNSILKIDCYFVYIQKIGNFEPNFLGIPIRTALSDIYISFFILKFILSITFTFITGVVSDVGNFAVYI